MTDGPHRSLPMRTGWKKVAERADNPAFEAQQVADMLAQAVERDFRAEVSDQVLTSLLEMFDDAQGDLFPDQRACDFDYLRRLAAGFALGELLVNCANHASDEGRWGEEGLLHATKNALYERGLRGTRQVEEHYCRRSDSSRASTVRARMEEGMELVSLDESARRVLRIDSGPIRPSVKQKGLDDGVRL